MLSKRFPLVVPGLPAGRTEDRRSQPSQAEDEQKRADHEPQRSEGDLTQRRAQGRDDHGQDTQGGGHADQPGSPAARQSDGQDDGGRFHHLHATRQEDGDQKSDDAGAQDDITTATGCPAAW
jgi:hypothetical protein